MTDPTPTPDPLVLATQRFAKAFAAARTADGQLQIAGEQMLTLMMTVELLKTHLAAFIDCAAASGMDLAEFNTSVAARLNEQATELEKPQLAIPKFQGPVAMRKR